MEPINKLPVLTDNELERMSRDPHAFANKYNEIAKAHNQLVDVVMQLVFIHARQFAQRKVNDNHNIPANYAHEQSREVKSWITLQDEVKLVDTLVDVQPIPLRGLHAQQIGRSRRQPPYVENICTPTLEPVRQLPAPLSMYVNVRLPKHWQAALDANASVSRALGEVPVFMCHNELGFFTIEREKLDKIKQELTDAGIEFTVEE